MKTCPYKVPLIYLAYSYDVLTRLLIITSHISFKPVLLHQFRSTKWKCFCEVSEIIIQQIQYK